MRSGYCAAPGDADAGSGAGAGVGAPTTVRPRRSTQAQHGGAGLILTPSEVQSVQDTRGGDLGEDVLLLRRVWLPRRQVGALSWVAYERGPQREACRSGETLRGKERDTPVGNAFPKAQVLGLPHSA